MQTYQPYYPGQMPLYQNYGQPIQQNFNLYAERLAQMQAQQVQPSQMPGANQGTISGKVVEGIDIVKATDIPMDGNMYYFPKADGSEIYVKQWLASGQTRTIVYKPVSGDQADNNTSSGQKSKSGLSDEATEVFMQRLDDISDKIEKLERSIRPKTKKEVASDE